MKTSRTVIALAVAALIPMGAAVANDKDRDMKSGSAQSFETVDTNRDGKISQAEASTDTTVVFTSADANGDGYLDKSEWRNRSKDSSSSPAPQSAPESSSDPAVPPADQSASEPVPDTETPRQ
jgi:hypothetical protein